MLSNDRLSAISFQRTTDYSLIRLILTDPDLYSRMGDDFTPPAHQFVVNPHPAICWVLVYDRLRLLGMFGFFPENEICRAAHVALFRGIHPRVTHQAGEEIVEWLWRNTSCERLIASVPLSNPAAVRFGLRAMGLVRYGVNPRSFLKNGILQSQILMGRSRL
jgi:hypothetical protein